MNNRSEDNVNQDAASIVRNTFDCSKCGHSIEVRTMGEVINCLNCNECLYVPRIPPCPSCDARSTRILSRDEQSKTNTGKIARTLMDGIAGLFASSLLDGVKKGVKKHFASPKFICDSCLNTWAIRLPVLNPNAIDNTGIVDEGLLLTNIGIELLNDEFRPLISSGSNVPCEHKQYFSIPKDSQDEISVNLFEGYTNDVKQCNKVGTYVISGIPSARRGVPKIEMIIRVSKSGQVSMIANETTTNKVLDVKHQSQWFLTC